MPAYVWITAAALVALAVFVALGRRWWRVKWMLDWLLVLSVPRWWYSWRHAAHVLEETAAEHGPAGWYGSMVLAEERGYTHPMSDDGWLPAPTVDPEPWRQQIAAELSPEALEDPPPLSRDLSGDLLAIPSNRIVEPLPEVVLPDAGGWISGPCLDPGPGDELPYPPSSPGPASDASWYDTWLEDQLGILFAWVRAQHAAGALTAMGALA